MKLGCFSITQQGKSHIEHGVNCQDFSGAINVHNPNARLEAAVVAIADGLGSCAYSEEGSRIAVTTVLDLMEKELPLLEEFSGKTVGTLLKKAYEVAHHNIEQEAEARELPLPLFDTTLTTAILVEDGACYFGHIGDDGIVALFTDGSYKMITNRIEGEFAGSVFPLSEKQRWTFGQLTKPVAALVLMTDGVLDAVVGPAQLNNRIFYPFFKPVFEVAFESEHAIREAKDSWDAYLKSDAFRETVTDDITFATVQRVDIVTSVTPLPFDEEKWNKETELYKAQTREALRLASETTAAEKADTDIDFPPILEMEEHPSNQLDNIPQLSSVYGDYEKSNENTTSKCESKPISIKKAYEIKELIYAIALVAIILMCSACYLFGYHQGKKDGLSAGYNEGLADAQSQVLIAAAITPIPEEPEEPISTEPELETEEHTITDFNLETEEPDSLSEDCPEEDVLFSSEVEQEPNME